MTQIKTGDGQRIVGRTLPAGWSPRDYGEQQVGPEMFIWAGEDVLIYSKNIIDDEGVFNYDKDVHSGIYAILRYNMTSRETETIVPSFPGGATRPELSRDKRTLAFVRRVRDKEALVLKSVHFFILRNNTNILTKRSSDWHSAQHLVRLNIRSRSYISSDGHLSFVLLYAR